MAKFWQAIIDLMTVLLWKRVTEIYCGTKWVYSGYFAFSMICSLRYFLFGVGGVKSVLCLMIDWIPVRLCSVGSFCCCSLVGRSVDQLEHVAWYGRKEGSMCVLSGDDKKTEGVHSTRQMVNSSPA